MIGRNLRIKTTGWIIAGVLRLFRSSWRIRADGMETFRNLYNAGTPFILCFWHGKYIPILPLFEGYEATVVTSRSNRGDVLSSVCSNLGYNFIQIPDHGGKVSMKLMEGLAGARAGAIAVDGPLGPYHVVKRGVVRLASTMGFSLLPASLSIQHKIVLRGRWDRLEVPLPFSRLNLRIGTPLQTPASGLSPGEIDSWSTRLTEIMEDLEMEKETSTGAR